MSDLNNPLTTAWAVTNVWGVSYSSVVSATFPIGQNVPFTYTSYILDKNNAAFTSAYEDTRCLASWVVSYPIATYYVRISNFSNRR